MTQNKNITGHLSALVTILIWGTTFITTKLLLTDFSPVEILFYRFLLGLMVSMAGICLISFNGNTVLRLNPLGDLLAVLAAIVWAGYAVLSRKISSYGYNTIQTTYFRTQRETAWIGHPIIF